MKGVIEVKVESDGIKVSGHLEGYEAGVSSDKEAALIATLVETMGKAGSQYMDDMEKVNEKLAKADTPEDREALVKEWAESQGKDPSDYKISSLDEVDDGDEVPSILH